MNNIHVLAAGLAIALLIECVLMTVRWLRREDVNFLDLIGGPKNRHDPAMFDDPLHDLILSGEGALEPEDCTVGTTRSVYRTARMLASPFMDVSNALPCACTWDEIALQNGRFVESRDEALPKLAYAATEIAARVFTARRANYSVMRDPVQTLSPELAAA